MGETSTPKTVFFKTCRGVFQGGGCRGAAHVGAYKAAVEAGVTFFEVAGTSAGSIIAVLIGAGGTPEYLTKHCASLKFSELLKSPERVIDTGRLRWLRFPMYFYNDSFIRNVVVHGGSYSSAKIETWIDDRLAELLPQAERPIKFRDLKLPTWVVATDLSGGRPKIWSASKTPDEEVGFAVRCSCSIPLFFEPVQQGTNLYIDGGMLSNLPSFVFADSADCGNTPGGRILAFCLVDDYVPIREWSMGNFLLQLANTLVSGATDIQASLQSNISTISVPTLGIKATDFDISDDQVQELMMAGSNSTLEFINKEVSLLKDRVACEGSISNEEDLFDAIVREGLTLGNELFVSQPDTKWFWKLFPTVTAWRATGARLYVFVPPLSGARESREREEQRRTYLRGIGACIHETNTLPVTGFVLGHEDDSRNAAFLINEADNAPYASSYIGSAHRPAIRAIRSMLVGEESIKIAVNDKVQLASVSEDPIIELLKKGVWQYTPESVSISLEEVQTRDVSLIVRRIRLFKLRQIELLASMYRKFNIPLFAPAEIRLSGKAASRTTPPIVEIWRGDAIVIEGNTRFSYLFNEGIAKTMCLVVRGVIAPLPGKPVPNGTARPYSGHLSPAEKIDGFNYDNFRSIEGAARPTHC